MQRLVQRLQQHTASAPGAMGAAAAAAAAAVAACGKDDVGKGVAAAYYRYRVLPAGAAACSDLPWLTAPSVSGVALKLAEMRPPPALTSHGDPPGKGWWRHRMGLGDPTSNYSAERLAAMRAEMARAMKENPLAVPESSARVQIACVRT